MRPPVRRLTLVLLSLQLVACTQWQLQTGSMRDVLASPENRTLRVTDTEGERFVARVVEVRSDSIYGTLGESGPVTCAEASSFCSLQMPVDQVGVLEVKRFSLIRTIAVVLVPAAVVVIAVTGDPSCSGPSTGNC